jgi:hypothetical protein
MGNICRSYVFRKLFGKFYMPIFESNVSIKKQFRKCFWAVFRMLFQTNLAENDQFNEITLKQKKTIESGSQKIIIPKNQLYLGKLGEDGRPGEDGHRANLAFPPFFSVFLIKRKQVLLLIRIFFK